jgi:hypothetical protein
MKRVLAAFGTLGLLLANTAQAQATRSGDSLPKAPAKASPEAQSPKPQGDRANPQQDRLIELYEKNGAPGLLNAATRGPRSADSPG